MAEALLGRLLNYVLLLKPLDSDTLQRLTEDRCFRQDMMVLSFMSMWFISNIRNPHVMAAVFGVGGKTGDMV